MKDSELEKIRNKHNHYDPDEVPHIDYRLNLTSRLSKSVRKSLGLIYHRLKLLKILK
ncbi:MAG: hypothetical protein P9L95_10335 [Candidatus Tenebribacter mawsonii]|nr:hypothetical protein [Candidatus Tenebribacter mawsonii]